MGLGLMKPVYKQVWWITEALTYGASANYYNLAVERTVKVNTEMPVREQVANSFGAYSRLGKGRSWDV